ncbi:MAG: hypothetical protein KatS3mg115_0147 [Candidatus Poribacteria bacterium]|nr:MAG: hypothetical protein KatS3mg115_0147 [Candidatus Poribacteria bacterium]
MGDYQANRQSYSPLPEEARRPEFWESVRKLVYNACREAGQPHLFEDAMQEACLEICRRKDRYDPTRGSFLQFVAVSVRYCVIHYCRRNSGPFTIPERVWRERGRGETDLDAALHPLSLDEPALELGGATLAHCTGDGGALGGIRVAFAPTDRSRGSLEDERRIVGLLSVLNRLPAREQEIWRLKEAGWKVAEIAQKLQLSRQRVHQILSEVRERLKEHALELTEPASRPSTP